MDLKKLFVDDLKLHLINRRRAISGQSGTWGLGVCWFGQGGTSVRIGRKLGCSRGMVPRELRIGVEAWNMVESRSSDCEKILDSVQLSLKCVK